MKDERKKIKELAKKIVATEKELANSNITQEEAIIVLNQMIGNLSIEEMLKIDEYIMQEKLLTK